MSEAAVFSPDGTDRCGGYLHGNDDVGARLANTLLENGARPLLEAEPPA